MKAETNGSRTHEPSLRELTAELDGLRDLLLAKIESNTQVMEVYDKLYTERDNSRRTAVEAALAAVKEQTKASFDASEKAIVKAEEAQKSYNQSHNDLARKMDEQNKATMPRPENETRFHALEEKIMAIRESVSASEGATRGGRAAIDTRRSDILALISILGFAAMLAFKLLSKG